MNQEKWVLITGASAGIGLATAELFADKKYNLILLARRLDRLKKLKAKILFKNSEINIQTFSVDLTDRNQVQTFLQTEKELCRKVDILVNNAGLALGVDKIQNGKPEDWDVMIDTNVKGLLYLTRGVLEFMISKQSGHVVNVGSVAGRWIYPGGGVYCATKFAVRALTEGLRLDLMGTPLRVTNVEPGMVETEFSEVRLGDKAAAKKIYENMQPLKAQDIAETIVWCAERPPHVNIQEIVVFPTDQPAVGYVHRGGKS